jgi:hypothetical protein
MIFLRYLFLVVLVVLIAVVCFGFIVNLDASMNKKTIIESLVPAAITA